MKLKSCKLGAIKIVNGIAILIGLLLVSATSTSKKTVDPVDNYYALIYNAQDLATKGNFEQSKAALLSAIDYGKNKFGAGNPLLFLSYNGLGILAKQLGKYQEALTFYNKAIDIIKLNHPINQTQLATVYVNIGNIYRLIGDYENALQYNYNAINYSLPDSSKRIVTIEASKINIANTYLDQKKYIAAIRTSKTLIKSSDPQRKILAYEFLARSYDGLNNFSQANQYYKLQISLIKKIKDSPNLGATYNYYSLFLLNNKHYNEAKYSLQQALYILRKNYGEKHYYTSYAYQNLGLLYEKQKITGSTYNQLIHKRKTNLLLAFLCYQKAIESVVDGYQNDNPFDNPPVSRPIDKRQLLSALKSKANILDSLSTLSYQAGNSFAGLIYLKKSLETYRLASELIQIIRSGFLNMESKLFLSESENDTYLNTIDIAYQLYRKTGNTDYLQVAFEFAERSKAAIFLASIKDNEAKHFGGIPDSLLLQEENIDQEISFYKEQIFQLKQSGSADSDRLKLWTSILLKKTQEQESLIHFFENKYPTYYNFKYRLNIISVPEVQSKLFKQDALIEYVINRHNNKDPEIYCFSITKDQFKVTRTTANINYDGNIKTLQNFLRNNNAINTTKQSYIGYCNAAFNLYQSLLSPIKKQIDGKKLIFVPDDQLSYIPFDALISQYPDVSLMDFRKPAYLIKDHAISYSYSATILFDREHQNRTASKSVLAFNPDYSTSEKNFSHPELWKHLSPLAGANTEVSNISQLFHTDIYSGSNASETNFKLNAPDYDILHLAMHTIINDNAPMYSRLIFNASNKKSNDDNFLNTQEIYNLKLNARLAVLSACNTGTGKLQRGEGVMSMARGFLYAGCPSTLMTLWEIDDKSSADMIKDFYYFLKKGNDKDEALRLAKLKHLDEADPLLAHPYYWQSYVLVGDKEPLFKAKGLYLLGAFLLIVVLGFMCDRFIQKDPRKYPKVQKFTLLIKSLRLKLSNKSERKQIIKKE